MTDLRTLPEVLLARGDIVTPPMATVVRRARVIQVRRRSMTVALALVLAVLAPSVAEWVTDGDPSSHVRLVDRTTTTTTMVALPGPGAAPEFVVGMGPTASPEGPSPPMTTTTTGTPSRALECRAGANGGATDVGVTENSVRIAMTETMEFPVRYVTATAYTSVDRLFDYVNLRGGICGRLLELRMANAAWRPFPWEADNDVVAALAGPLDGGVNTHVVNGDIDRAEVPLVGTDGLTAAHHHSPWIWPIGPSTASFTRIAMDHAYDTAHARTFALVYESTGPVGSQAAAAFNQYIEHLPGARAVHMQPLDTSDDDYKQEADEFSLKCGVVTCDFVLFALLPETAKKWIALKPTMGRLRTAALPFLLDTPFWRDCPKSLTGSTCTNFHVWTAYPRFDRSYWTGPVGLCRYVESNPATAVANLSACTIVEALRRVGPNVTRVRLREAIDAVAYESGLVSAYRGGRRIADSKAGQTQGIAWRPVYSALSGEFERLEVALSNPAKDPKPSGD